MPAKKSSHFYSVIILSYRSHELSDAVKRQKISAFDAAAYDVTNVYFGYDKRALYAKFFQAVERAQKSPLAFCVYVWRDTEIIVRVTIEHDS